MMIFSGPNSTGFKAKIRAFQRKENDGRTLFYG